jgi:hypothetical protein
MSAQTKSRAAEYFAAMPDLDWSDLSRVHATTAPILAEIAGDRELMREMILGAHHHPSLWPKCEEGVVEDKIVLWDEPNRGFRLRLRMATADQEEMPHQHRFVFSNYVLRGHFVHRNYKVDGSFGERTKPEDVSTVIIHEDVAGHCFTISPAAVHSTPLPEPGTINLVLRGPAVRDRAPVIFAASRARGAGDGGGAEAPTLEEPETAERGHVFFRVGEKEEGAERRAERQMSDETYAAWIGRFREYGLI